MDNKGGSWLDADVQENILEKRAALLAQRHLQDTSRGSDCSYDVLELTMAHSDLNYWRGFRSQLSKAPKDSTDTLTALFQVVSRLPRIWTLFSEALIPLRRVRN